MKTTGTVSRERAELSQDELLAADLHYLYLKQSGELQRRQGERNMRDQIQENFRNQHANPDGLQN